MAAVACFAGLVGCSPRIESTRTPPLPVVAVIEARKQDVPLQVAASGTTRALKEVSIRARVRGFLRKQEFVEGTDVKKGQLLFVIEEDQFKAKLDASEAELAEANASLELAKASKSREVAKAQLDVTVALEQVAKAEVTRVRALEARNAIARQDIDRAVANQQKCAADVGGARASLEQADSDFGINITAAQAKVASALASVAEAKINFGYCRMYAEIDGRIGEAKVTVGNLVGSSPGGEATELATIQQLNPMGVNIQASSRYLERATKVVRDGLSVRVERPGIEGETIHPEPGKIVFIDNSVDSATSTILMKAEIPNSKASLLPGDYVQVRLIIGQMKDVVVVPEQAVMETQGGQVVYVVDQAGKVASVGVKSNYTYERMRVIESGLAAGASVIVEGVQLARPGASVKAEPYTTPAKDGFKTP
jgi:RND family efflux transporter MFP subunit